MGDADPGELRRDAGSGKPETHTVVLHGSAHPGTRASWWTKGTTLQHLGLIFLLGLMLSHQGVALLERTKRCGLLGVSGSLGVGVEVSKAQARLGGSFVLLPSDPYIELSQPPHATILPDRMIKE